MTFRAPVFQRPRARNRPPQEFGHDVNLPLYGAPTATPISGENHDFPVPRAKTRLRVSFEGKINPNLFPPVPAPIAGKSSFPAFLRGIRRTPEPQVGLSLLLNPPPSPDTANIHDFPNPTRALYRERGGVWGLNLPINPPPLGGQTPIFPPIFQPKPRLRVVLHEAGAPLNLALNGITTSNPLVGNSIDFKNPVIGRKINQDARQIVRILPISPFGTPFFFKGSFVNPTRAKRGPSTQYVAELNLNLYPPPPPPPPSANAPVLFIVTR